MKVSGREKLFVWGGAAVLGVVLLVQLAVVPAVKRSGELNRITLQKEQELKEVRRLSRELQSIRETKAQLLQKIPPQERALPPLSRLDGWISRSGLRQNIRSIKPSPPTEKEGTVIEVQVEKAELPQLTRFFYEVQSSPGGSRIERLSIKPRYTTPKYLDVSLQMVFYQG